ncbi:Cytadherence high molecular weight protein 2 [Frankliniella fusca]|uniref:Cytadherence high molecular weight protein 2 n=1 Tax=Frankliniella fusca TaxID=407009 RepID=A0AAE1L9M2_9NEOP|nr:Cytadherence high molecular weight protein 2 [Frankliniella fusca]
MISLILILTYLILLISYNAILNLLVKKRLFSVGTNFLNLVSKTNLDIENGSVVDINFERNGCFVNKYNPWVLQTWRSNIDFSPILNKQIVYRYIAKYASKAEVKSISYNEVLTDIVNKTCDDFELSKKAIRKLLISSCAKRDYSSQEVMHFEMGYNFYHSSREFVVINLKNIDWTSVSYNHTCKTIFDLYANRSVRYQKLSLFEFAKHIKFLKTQAFVRKKSAIVRFFPRIYNTLPTDTIFTNLAILFYPWRAMDDVVPGGCDVLARA